MSKTSARGRAAQNSHLQEVHRWRAWADARKDEAFQLGQAQLNACRSCRECGCEVQLTERICPNCGIADPVRVPMALPTALGVAAVMVLCALIWVL